MSIFPFREDLSAWLFFIASTLRETERQVVMNHLTTQKVKLRDYTREKVKEVIKDMLQAPRNAIEDPPQRHERGGKGRGGPRSFCIMEEVEDSMSGLAGYWVEEEEFGYLGFILATEHDPDEFWYFDDSSENPFEHCWKVYCFRGRYTRRGKPRRGGQGKGKGGRRRFRRRRKGRGRG